MLNYPLVTTRRHRVLFDDTCALCRQTVRILKRLDWFHRFEWIGWNTLGAAPRVDGVSSTDLQRSVHILTSEGKIHAAARGLRFVACRLPLTVLPAGLLFLPGALGCAEIVYAWISRHRHKLNRPGGGAVCRSCPP